jgi:hypothetical protein
MSDREEIRNVEKKASLVVTVITWAAAIAIVVVLCVVLYSVWRSMRPY